MATRPIFVPDPIQPPFVKEVMVNFQWYPGFSISQAQKSILALHKAANSMNISPVLEISSKSIERLGYELSAFNLMIRTKDEKKMSVECAFQGSKIFEKGGPFNDLYSVTSREAKKDQRLRNSGELVGFSFLGDEFPIKPLTAFYDWLYLNALYQNSELAEKLLDYKGFSDIAFNPEKSYNCQARSAAFYVALRNLGMINDTIQDKSKYLKVILGESKESKNMKKTRKNIKKTQVHGQLDLDLKFLDQDNESVYTIE